jgi:hypothetical protein
MNSKRCGLGAVAVTLLSLVATPAFAQLCVGVPLNVSQTSLSLRADMPDGANIFALRAASHLIQPLTLAASYQLFSPEVGDSRHAIGADAAFEVPLGSSSVGVCAVAGASVTLADDPRSISVPVGLALGTNVEIGPGLSVVPFAVPQLYWTRHSYEGFDPVSDTNFGIEGGANLIVSNLAFGVVLERLFADNAKTTFGVFAAMNF